MRLEYILVFAGVHLAAKNVCGIQEEAFELGEGDLVPIHRYRPSIAVPPSGATPRMSSRHELWGTLHCGITLLSPSLGLRPPIYELCEFIGKFRGRRPEAGPKVKSALKRPTA